MLVEPNVDEEACCPKSPCNVIRKEIVEPVTPTIVGVIPSEDVCIGVDKPLEVIRKNRKRSMIFKNEKDHGGRQLMNPDHQQVLLIAAPNLS